MAVSGFASLFAVDAGWSTCACKRAIMGGTCTAGGVVAGLVGTSAERADDGALADRALGDGVIKGVAPFTAAEDREGGEFFNGGGASEEGRWVFDKLGKAGAVGVDESKSDGGVVFLHRDGAMEPLGWVDEGESFACGVAHELPNQGHRRGDVACGVTLNRDAVYHDLGVAFLWDNAHPGAKRGCEDGPVPVYLVVGRLACEGQDEVVGKA